MEVDDALQSLPEVEYFRYMDDIAIVSASREATAALQQLGESCYQAGLPLSTQKTEALPYGIALAELQEETFNEFEPGPYATNEEVIQNERASCQYLANLLEASFKRSGQIDSRMCKVQLFRLCRFRDRNVLGLVLNNLDNLGPMAADSLLLVALDRRAKSGESSSRRS